MVTFHAKQFHKHGPAPVSEKGCNASWFLKALNPNKAKQLNHTRTHTPLKKYRTLKTHLYGQVWGFGRQVEAGIRLYALVCVVGSWGWNESPCGLEGEPACRGRGTPLNQVSWAHSLVPGWVRKGCPSGDVMKGGRSWGRSSHPSLQCFLQAPSLYSSTDIREH